MERIIKLKEAYHDQEASVRGWPREFQLLEENRLNFGDPLNYCQGVTVEKLMRTPTLTMLISLGLSDYWVEPQFSELLWLEPYCRQLSDWLRSLTCSLFLAKLTLPYLRLLLETCSEPLLCWKSDWLAIKSCVQHFQAGGSVPNCFFFFLITSVPLYLCSSLK